MTSQDAHTARQQALDEAVKQKLTTEQQQARERQILQQLQREREKKENPAAAAARREAEREAHRQAVLEAQRLAQETEGAQRFKIRTEHEFAPDSVTSSSRITGETVGRSRHRDQEQFSVSGAPVQLEGDPAAIQSLRFQAFQQASRKGGIVDEAAINRETRNILKATGGQITLTDTAARDRAITEAYLGFKNRKDTTIAESDQAILTPVPGIRSRSVAEGFSETGQKETFFVVDDISRVSDDLVGNFTIVQRPKASGKGAPPNDLIGGITGELENYGELFKTVGYTYFKAPIAFLGGRDSSQAWYDIEFEQARSAERLKPSAEVELFGATAESVKSLAGGKPTAAPFVDMLKTFSGAPLTFAGAALVSGALFFIPSTKSLGIVRGGVKGLTAVSYAKAAKPLAMTFVKTFRQPGFGEIAASIERMGYLSKRPGPMIGLPKQFIREQKVSIDTELTTLERDLGLDLLPAKTRIESAAVRIAGPVADFGRVVVDEVPPRIEALAALRPKLPELPQFGVIFEPVTSRVRQAGEFAAMPFRATRDFAILSADVIGDAGRRAASVAAYPYNVGFDLTSRGLDIFTGRVRRAKTTIEPYAYLRPNEERIKEAIDANIIQPLRPLPFTEPFFTGRATARAFGADIRFAGGVLNLGLDPYRLLGKRIHNLVGESEAIFDTDFLRFTREGRQIRAGSDLLKATGLGAIESPQRLGKGSAIFDVDFEETAKMFQSGFIKAGKEKGTLDFSLITREALPPELRASIKSVGAKVEGIFVKETTGRKDLTPFGEIRDDTLRTVLPKTERQPKLPIFPKIELSPAVDEFLQTFTGVPRAAKKPIRVADVITYPGADIIKYAKALQSPEDVFRLSRSEVAKMMGIPEKHTRIFDFEPTTAKPTKTSRTPLESINEFDFDRELRPFSKIIDSYVKKSLGIEGTTSKAASGGSLFGAGFSVRGLGLGGGAGFYTPKVSLGFGGATGVERRRRRDDAASFFSEIEAVVYPKEIVRPIERLKGFTETKSSNAFGIKTDSIIKNMLGNLNKISMDLTPRLSTSSRTNLAQSPFTGVRTDAIVRTGLQSDQMMRQLTRQLTRQTTINPTRTPPGRPILSYPFPVFAGEDKKKKKKSKKRKVRYTKSKIRLVSPLSAVLGVNTPIGREIQKFTERYA